MLKKIIRSSKKSSKGFTLIELLIVVIILGILAAIVTIGVAGARNKSVEKSCQSSAVALASALDSYYIENGEFPEADNATAGWFIKATKRGVNGTPIAAFSTYLKAIPPFVVDGQQLTVAGAPTAGDYFLKITYPNGNATVQGFTNIGGTAAFDPAEKCKFPAN